MRWLVLAAALAVALTLAAAGEAGAVAGGSILFARDSNIWLTSPDGTTQRPLTSDGTAATPYYSPTQSADGSVIVAARLRTEPSGVYSSLYEMDRQGTLLRPPFDPPQIARVDSGPGTPCPGYFRIPNGIRAAVSPDASKIAIDMFSSYYLPPGCGGPALGDTSEVYVLDGSTAGAVIAQGPNPTPLTLAEPFWTTDSQLIMSASALVSPVEYYDLGAAGTATWTSSAESGFSARSPSVGGGRLATVSRMRVRLWTAPGPVPAAPTARCDVFNPDHPAFYFDSAFKMGSATMAPDGAGVAWVEQDVGSGGTVTASRIYVSPVGDIGAGDCGSIGRRLLIEGGSDPSWGAAPVGPAGSSPTPVCPSGQTGTPPACASPPATCPAGQTGTPPGCSAPAQQPPAVVPPRVVPATAVPPASPGGVASRPRTRTVRVVVKLRSGCSRKLLSVAGKGVEVIAAKRLPRSKCRVTLRVTAGVRGRRSLRVTAHGRTTKRAVIRL